MKNIRSLVVCVLTAVVLLLYREANIAPDKPLKITLWDATGYYLYLPSLLIYHDFKQLDWLAAIDQKYSVTGGGHYPAERAGNGNYAFKYLGGVAIMELPFFFIGDQAAKHLGYPPDGFSPPYQYALGFGILLYSLLAILLLRKILLLYFNDRVTAAALLLVCLATNYIQYAAVDSGQSHAYIFLLYALILYATIKWHQRPAPGWACVIGYLAGLATISRPTEAIIILIPILWETQNKEAAKAKWQKAGAHKTHVALAAVSGIIGILPQLIYWKAATGSFVYDVGSKWDFLLPHFQVLFGFEKGWFIYTPVTVFFVIALFVNKTFPFSKAALWFCLLNIYIIIAWHDWHYGGSYSTRALVQSYPVFALPFAALIDRADRTKWRIPFYVLGIYLIGVNLFQITQYCSTVLNYDSMNRKYYSRIYLNPHPTPLDMGMLDNDEMPDNVKDYSAALLCTTDRAVKLHFPGNSSSVLFDIRLRNTNAKDRWIKVESDICAPQHLWMSDLNADLIEGDSVKHARVRLGNAIAKDEKTNSYAFYVSVPQYFRQAQLKVYVSSAYDFDGVAEKVKVTEFTK